MLSLPALWIAVGLLPLDGTPLPEPQREALGIYYQNQEAIQEQCRQALQAIDSYQNLDRHVSCHSHDVPAQNPLLRQNLVIT